MKNPILRSEIRRGAYYDSIVLMQLQVALAALDGVDDSGVVMATEANLAQLERGGLLPSPRPEAAAEDLLLVVRAESAEAADAALAQVDTLLARRRGASPGDAYQPKSLAAAVRQLPEARWVLVSVAGRWA